RAEAAARRRSNRIVKIGCGVIAAACLAFGAIPRASSSPSLKSVMAEQFVLVDGSGRTRATLGAPPAGDGDGFALTFYDRNGKQTAMLGEFSDDTESLSFWDGNEIVPGAGRFRLAAGIGGPTSKSQGPGYGLYDDTGAQRAVLASSLDQKSSVVALIDTNGTSVGLSNNETSNAAGFFANDANGVNREFGGVALNGAFGPVLTINDSTGLTRTVMSEAADESAAGLNVFDAAGTHEVGVGDTLKGNSAGIEVWDSNGNLRAAGGWDSTNQEHFTLFNSSGSTTFQAP